MNVGLTYLMDCFIKQCPCLLCVYFYSRSSSPGASFFLSVSSRPLLSLPVCLHWLSLPVCLQWLSLPVCLHWLSLTVCLHWLSLPVFLHWLSLPVCLHWLSLPVCLHWLSLPVCFIGFLFLCVFIGFLFLCVFIGPSVAIHRRFTRIEYRLLKSFTSIGLDRFICVHCLSSFLFLITGATNEFKLLFLLYRVILLSIQHLNLPHEISTVDLPSSLLFGLRQ